MKMSWVNSRNAALVAGISLITTFVLDSYLQSRMLRTGPEALAWFVLRLADAVCLLTLPGLLLVLYRANPVLTISRPVKYAAVLTAGAIVALYWWSGTSVFSFDLEHMVPLRDFFEYTVSARLWDWLSQPLMVSSLASGLTLLGQFSLAALLINLCIGRNSPAAALEKPVWLWRTADAALLVNCVILIALGARLGVLIHMSNHSVLAGPQPVGWLVKRYTLIHTPNVLFALTTWIVYTSVAMSGRNAHPTELEVEHPTV